MDFKELKLPRQYLRALEDLEFEKATPIQTKAIPAIRSGQHVIGIAQTGTGKTAAYVLPILQNLSYAQGDGPRAIILVPTKELVLQVTEQISQLAKYTDLRSTGIYGGVGPKAQAQRIKEGIDILVSTPRRLLEFYEKENLQVSRLSILVLDEADKMLDMGFLPQINLILDLVPRKKQNLLFSATFSAKVEELSWNFMDFPTKIEITPEATPVETVEQIRYLTPNIQSKLRVLENLLKEESRFCRIIVFTKTKKTAKQVFEYLDLNTNGAIRLIHSNKSQNARINSFNAFRKGKLRILVATDVMARGIDIDEVSHVINFDVPIVHEDYIHRIGRTGRAFKTGCAITFSTRAENYHILKIEDKMRMKIPVRPLPETIEIPETPFAENQEMEREIDQQKRKENPDYKGAFHEKKTRKSKQKNKQRRRSKPYIGKGSYFTNSQSPKKSTSKNYRRKNKKK